MSYWYFALRNAVESRTNWRTERGRLKSARALSGHDRNVPGGTKAVGVIARIVRAWVTLLGAHNKPITTICQGVSTSLQGYVFDVPGTHRPFWLTKPASHSQVSAQNSVPSHCSLNSTAPLPQKVSTRRTMLRSVVLIATTTTSDRIVTAIWRLIITASSKISGPSGDARTPWSFAETSTVRSVKFLLSARTSDITYNLHIGLVSLPKVPSYATRSLSLPRSMAVGLAAPSLSRLSFTTVKFGKISNPGRTTVTESLNKYLL